jgi:hypothetical protein
MNSIKKTLIMYALWILFSISLGGAGVYAAQLFHEQGPSIVFNLAATLCVFYIYGTTFLLIELSYSRIGIRATIKYWVMRNILQAEWFYPIRTYKIKRKLKKEKDFIPKDEFHPSLNMDGSLMFKLNDNDREKYLTQLANRRQRAHDQDIFLSDLKEICDEED